MNRTEKSSLVFFLMVFVTFGCKKFQDQDDDYDRSYGERVQNSVKFNWDESVGALSGPGSVILRIQALQTGFFSGVGFFSNKSNGTLVDLSLPKSTYALSAIGYSSVTSSTLSLHCGAEQTLDLTNQTQTSAEVSFTLNQYSGSGACLNNAAEIAAGAYPVATGMELKLCNVNATGTLSSTCGSYPAPANDGKWSIFKLQFDNDLPGAISGNTAIYFGLGQSAPSTGSWTGTSWPFNFPQRIPYTTFPMELVLGYSSGGAGTSCTSGTTLKFGNGLKNGVTAITTNASCPTQLAYSATDLSIVLASSVNSTSTIYLKTICASSTSCP